MGGFYRTGMIKGNNNALGGSGNFSSTCIVFKLRIFDHSRDRPIPTASCLSARTDSSITMKTYRDLCNESAVVKEIRL